MSSTSLHKQIMTLDSENVGVELGLVSRVQKSSLEFRFAAPQSSSAQVDHSGNVGDYVVVESSGVALFGQIKDVRTSEIQELNAANSELVSVGIVQLLSTIDSASEEITPGVHSHPHIRDGVFSAHPKLVRAVAEARNKDSAAGQSLTIALGELPDARNTSVSFTPEMLFGRHMAILGTTGAGKSWSLAKLVEEASKFRAKIILFDASGEFGALSNKTHHVHIGYDPTPHTRSTEVNLPYQTLIESDLLAIFKPTGPAQAPKLRAAMKSLKLAKLNPKLAVSGCIVKCDKSKLKFEGAYSEFYEQIESRGADFNIRNLGQQIENECVNAQRSPFEPDFWGGMNGPALGRCMPLISRVNDIVGSRNLAPIFAPGDKPSLFEAIDLFMADKRSSVLRVNLQYLSFEHSTREIIANAAARYLLKLGRANTFKNNPMLLVVDEAHQFLNRTSEENFSEEHPLDSFSDIAKEGRKYGLTTCLATQRPRDIPDGVLSQMGTLLVHRLINDLDRRVVERASGELDDSSLAALPSLAPGEGMLIGVEFPIPLKLKIIAPTAKPDSRGPDYQSCWKPI